MTTSHDAVDHARRVGGQPWWSTSSGRTVLTWVAILSLAAVSVPMHVAAAARGIPPGGLDVPWWALAAVMLATELAVIHVQVGDDAHSFTLNELPLVLGLAFVPPTALIIGHVVGVAGALLVQGPRTPAKAAFNLALAHLEVVGAVLLYHHLLGTSSPASLEGGIAAVVVALVTQLGGLLAITAMLALHTGTPPRELLARTFAPTMFTYVGLATIAAVTVFVLSEDPSAWVLLVVVGLLVLVFFRAYRRLRDRHNDLEAVYAFTRALASAETDRDPTATVLRTVLDVLRCDIAELHLTGDVPAAHRFDRELEGTAGPVAPLAPSLRGELAALVGTSPGVIALDLVEQAAPTVAAALTDAGYRCALAVALEHDGRPVGTVLVGNRNGPEPAFTEDDDRLLAAFAQQIAVTLERNQLVWRLRHEAMHDGLTQLANRASFLRHVDESLARDASGPGTAVLLLDLDRFKEVNDTLGHAAGDQLLREVSSRLLALVGSNAFVGRLGGDEFVVVLRRTGLVAAVAVAQAVVEGIETAFECEDVRVEVGVSIGISLSPHHGADAKILLQRADVAMYAAKRTGHGYAIYDPNLDDHSVRSLTLAAHLRAAVEDGGIEVHFQPQVRADDGQVVALEALARWNHPQFGHIPPSEFIPLAERTGTIRPLTSHVLREAVQTVLELDPDGSLSVAVNISPRVLMDATLPGAVASLLADTGLAPGRLVLELTEDSLVSEGDRVPVVLESLAALGVRLSIDDFGTGYSSLSYLPRIPAHELKIDRSFVMRMAKSEADATIVQSTIELASRLGLAVVAEGVESQTEWDRLAQMGCDVLQGYHISRPLPRASLRSFLRPVHVVRAAADAGREAA